MWRGKRRVEGYLYVHFIVGLCAVTAPTNGVLSAV